MEDEDGPGLAQAVYEALFRAGEEYLDPDSIPYALDDFAQSLRRCRMPPSRWATFVHIGM